MGLWRTKEPEVVAETPMPWEKEPPVGFAWTPTTDSFVPLHCLTCGAAVWPSAVGIHDAWHASL